MNLQLYRLQESYMVKTLGKGSYTFLHDKLVAMDSLCLQRTQVLLMAHMTCMDHQ